MTNPWLFILSISAGFAILACLYTLHRLALWLEARGLLYYKHKKPESSAASCLMAFHQAIGPGVTHVIQVKEVKRHHSEEEAPGCTDEDDNFSRSESENRVD